MTDKKKQPIQHKDQFPEKKDKTTGASFPPSGKGLSGHFDPDVDSYKAPNQQREKTDGLTSNQNIGRNADLNYSDDVGLNKHPELKKKQGNTSGTQLSGGTKAETGAHED